jgi:hypothetical protein
MTLKCPALMSHVKTQFKTIKHDGPYSQRNTCQPKKRPFELRMHNGAGTLLGPLFLSMPVAFATRSLDYPLQHIYTLIFLGQTHRTLLHHIQLPALQISYSSSKPLTLILSSKKLTFSTTLWACQFGLHDPSWIVL